VSTSKKHQRDEDSQQRIPAASGDVLIPAAGSLSAQATIQIEITAQKLRDIVVKLHFATDGDHSERQYWPILKERFPNCERFWQHFVTPMTKRVENPPEPGDRIRRREGIAEEVWDIGYLNYSLFLHFAAAYEHMQGHIYYSFVVFFKDLCSV
jgi:hypothetical protein